MQTSSQLGPLLKVDKLQRWLGPNSAPPPKQTANRRWRIHHIYDGGIRSFRTRQDSHAPALREGPVLTAPSHKTLRTCSVGGCIPGPLGCALVLGQLELTVSYILPFEIAHFYRLRFHPVETLPG